MKFGLLYFCHEHKHKLELMFPTYDKLFFHLITHLYISPTFGPPFRVKFPSPVCSISMNVSFSEAVTVLFFTSLIPKISNENRRGFCLELL